jgi:thioredoxin reductase/ferredoxin
MSPPPPLASLDVAAAQRTRGKTVRRAEATSDVLRARHALGAALVAAMVLAVMAAVASALGYGASPGPLARPHVVAKVGCASCHGSEGGAVAACTTCHGAHASVRAGHRAKLASGELRCVDCHPAHGGAGGVTFGEGGRFIQWDNGNEKEQNYKEGGDAGAVTVFGASGASVPFVATSPCARCHHLGDPADPAARCAPPGASSGGVSRCFDEHQRPTAGAVVGSVRGGGTACARQHGPSRFAEWEAASQVLARTGPAARSSPSLGPLGAVFGALASGGLAFVLLGSARRRRARAVESVLAAPAASPRALLPRIDASTCLGCYACVDACPFDVLVIERYVAVVARPRDCCGVVLCQQVCPNGSLTIAEGPALAHTLRIDADGESIDTPGVFVAGDLSGVPLIKNAILQGRRAVDRVADKLPRGARGRAGIFDVAIVGAGPAGLSAVLRAQELGLSYVCLEQGTVAQSVRSFPRGKLVFDQPLSLPLEGDLWLKECTKEELLSQWARIVRKRNLQIHEEHRVEAIERSEADVALSAAGKTFRAQRLVLAIGKRGTPRALDCPIDEAARAKVAYSLADARSFAGQRVLIVGLGDSAMEAAIALARQPSTTVTISYRGEGFSRGKSRNIAELKALAARGAVRIAWSTRVSQVREPDAVLESTAAGAPQTLACDAVIVLLGGTPAWDLLRLAGVRASVAVSPDEAPSHGSIGGVE